MGIPVMYDQLNLLSTKDVCDQNSHFKLPNTMMLGGNVLFLMTPSIADLQANILLCINHAFNFGIIQLPFGKIKRALGNNANMLHLSKHKCLPKLFKNSLEEI